MRRTLLNGKMIVLLAVFLVLSMAVGVAEAEKKSGNWKCVLEGDGATITGYVKNPKGTLTIPSKLGKYPVTEIGAWAFENSDITYAIIPDSVASIGEGAFAGCFVLTAVTIPDSVTSIGSWAFNGCTSLTSVIIPDSVMSIGEGAFEDCGLMYGGLKIVTIPPGVTFIGEGAFAGCKNLTLVVIESSYAEQYAKKNNIPYDSKDAGPPLQGRSSDGPHQIQPSTDGYECDYAYIGGWSIFSMCSINDEGELVWGLYGQADSSGEKVLLEEKSPRTIIPCGDSFVYLGYNQAGRQQWLTCKPGEKPIALPLTWKDSVFYGFDGGCWYTRISDSKSTLYSIGLDGKNKRRLGTVKVGSSGIEGVLADSSIVLYDFDARTILTWKDGAYSELYSFSGNGRIDVWANKDSVWVSHDGHFGRLENGVMYDIQEGYASPIGRTAHQLVFLVRDHLNSDEANVLLVNDMTRSYTYLGLVPFPMGNHNGLEYYSDHLVYWGNGRHVLAIPADMSAWTSYEH